MGTFTKSFSGMGGNIAGSKQLITTYANALGTLYHYSNVTHCLSVCTQVLTAFNVIMDCDGTDIGKGRPFETIVISSGKN
jgi:7-keto-8-aminopelargonate synthetase-like enzyme